MLKGKRTYIACSLGIILFVAESIFGLDIPGLDASTNTLITSLIGLGLRLSK